MPVERDTIFRVASMTKPVTTVAALMVHDEGRFDLDEPIAVCSPELARMRVPARSGGLTLADRGGRGRSRFAIS